MDRPKIPVDLILAKLAADAEAAKHRLERPGIFSTAPWTRRSGPPPMNWSIRKTGSG